MFNFNVSPENICLMCSEVTEIKHWFKIEESKVLLFLFKVSENLDRKFWPVYSGIILCSWLFLEVIAINLKKKIGTDHVYLNLELIKNLIFLYKKSSLLFNTKYYHQRETHIGQTAPFYTYWREYSDAFMKVKKCLYVWNELKLI